MNVKMYLKSNRFTKIDLDQTHLVSDLLYGHVPSLESYDETESVERRMDVVKRNKMENETDEKMKDEKESDEKTTDTGVMTSGDDDVGDNLIHYETDDDDATFYPLVYASV